MATANSDLYTLQTKNGTDRPKSSDYYGRVRVACIDTKLTAAANVINLVQLPAGRIRILGASQITATLATNTTTVKIGYPAYTKLDGTSQTGDDDAFMTATAASSVSAKGLINGIVESQSGVTLQATLSANGAANDTLKGFILFVID